MKITFCKILTLIIAVTLLSSLCMTAFATEFTPYPINTPWETKIKFENYNTNPKIKLDGTVATDWTNNQITTFCNIALQDGGSGLLRDGYTDEVSGEYVYDSLSGEEGDYYLLISQEPDSSKKPAFIYYNVSTAATAQTHSNGGAIYSNAVFDFDIRVQPGKWSDNVANLDIKATAINLYGWNIAENKRVTIGRMGIESYDKTSQSWYPTYRDSDLGKFKGMPIINDVDSWYKLRMCVDVKNQKITYFVLNSDGVIVSQSAEQSFIGACDYALPALQIAFGYYRDISIDNLRVAKETYIVDDPVISENDTDITASVNVGHNVYAVQGQGGDVSLTSPIAVLAAYDKNNKLLSIDSASVEFTDKVLADKNEAKFIQAPEYKCIDLKIDKPQKEYTLKLYVWNNYFEAAPYIIDIN